MLSLNLVQAILSTTHSHEHAESEANMTAKLQITEFRADLYEALDKPELINASPELIKLPSARR